MLPLEYQWFYLFVQLPRFRHERGKNVYIGRAEVLLSECNDPRERQGTWEYMQRSNYNNCLLAPEFKRDRKLSEDIKEIKWICRRINELDVQVGPGKNWSWDTRGSELEAKEVVREKVAWSETMGSLQLLVIAIRVAEAENQAKIIGREEFSKDTRTMNGHLQV